MQGLSFSERQQFIDEFSHEIYDLAIIGGGINGAGVARDASSRGMKVALVEAQDFASGTSSRSSKLIHGGIRYLENLEFGLVFESLRERRILMEIAPHLVHPLRFVLPLYRGGRVGMFKMGLGMWLYDTLALFEVPEMHERLNSSLTLSRVPSLESKNLLGSYVYSDAYMDDDRLVLETLRSAAHWGARCLSYVKATGRILDSRHFQKLICKDLENGKEIIVKAKHIVSTVGPWTDHVGEALIPKWRKIIRPSKGIHLTLAHDRLPLSSAVVMAADKQSRIIFAIPRRDMVIIGTTDTDYLDDPANVSTQRADVDYLLGVINEYFPGIKISYKDVISSYAGVRPLVDDGSSTEGKTSREHLILQDPSGVTFVAGGKYTTYRHMAEQTLESILGSLSSEDQARYGRNRTKEPLNPLISVQQYEGTWRSSLKYARLWEIPESVGHSLILRHGLEAERLAEIYRSLPNSESPETRMWQCEAQFAIQNTMCFHLSDFILRRTPLFLARRDHGESFIGPLLKTFSNALDWNDARRNREVQEYQLELKRELFWKD